MRVMRMPYLRMKKTVTGAIVSLTLATVALQTGCKGKPPVSQEKKPAGAAPETTEMKRLRAEVPSVLVQRVIAFGQPTFRESKEAQSKWRTPEEMGLALYRSTELLAAVARADNLTSNPTVARWVHEGLIKEYATMLFERGFGPIPVSDAEIKAYYEDHLSSYRIKGKFSFRQIFLNIVDNPGKEKEKEALAEKALAEINAGTSFAKVAEKYSDNKVKNEVIGPVQCGEINSDLEKTILALEAGQHTGVIRTKYGFHVFRLEEAEKPATKTLEAVRDSIVRELRSEKYPQSYEVFLAELEQKYPATKHYDILADPKTPDSAVVVESQFLKLTVGEYRMHINERFSTPTRASLDEAENRAAFLDEWVQSKRIEYAANEARLPTDPDAQTIARFMTNAMLARIYHDGVVSKVTEVSEEEVRKHYEDYHESYAKEPAKVRLRDIVVGYKQPEGTSARDVHLVRMKARAQIEEVIAKLKGGAKFEDLARQYSTSPSKKDGGELGFIDPDRRFNKLREALDKLQIGEWTQPLDEGEAFGISIFLLEERKPEVLVPLDDTFKKQLAEILLAKKRNDLATEIRVRLAEAYHQGMSVDESRRIVNEAVAQAIAKPK